MISSGFYRTGDIVRLTRDGYIVVEGRAKDQINRGGEKVAAEEVENHLLAHPAVHDIMDSRMRQQMIFYLFSRNLFSSTVNLILRPAFNDNIAVSCQPDDITRTVKT